MLLSWSVHHAVPCPSTSATIRCDWQKLMFFSCTSPSRNPGLNSDEYQTEEVQKDESWHGCWWDSPFFPLLPILLSSIHAHCENSFSHPTLCCDRSFCQDRSANHHTPGISLLLCSPLSPSLPRSLPLSLSLSLTAEVCSALPVLIGLL